MNQLSALRQRTLNAGTDERQLEILRHALASTEDARKLRAVSCCVSELAETIAEKLLGEVADLQDRCYEKLTRIGVPVLVRRSSPPQRDGGHVASPAIKMRFSDWVVDEFGVRGRVLWNASDGPVPP
jgi:hypothetical protein